MVGRQEHSFSLRQLNEHSAIGEDAGPHVRTRGRGMLSIALGTTLLGHEAMGGMTQPPSGPGSRFRFFVVDVHGLAELVGLSPLLLCLQRPYSPGRSSLILDTDRVGGLRPVHGPVTSASCCERDCIFSTALGRLRRHPEEPFP